VEGIQRETLSLGLEVCGAQRIPDCFWRVTPYSPPLNSGPAWVSRANASLFLLWWDQPPSTAVGSEQSEGAQHPSHSLRSRGPVEAGLPNTGSEQDIYAGSPEPSMHCPCLRELGEALRHQVETSGIPEQI
jgi:hypothetical protein